MERLPIVEDYVDTDSESAVNSVNKTLKLKPVNLSIDDISVKMKDKRKTMNQDLYSLKQSPISGGFSPYNSTKKAPFETPIAKNKHE